MDWKTKSEAILSRISVWKRVLRHPETPLVPKLMLGLALGYLALPFDLIPDFIPILGVLDDLVIVPGLIWLAVRMISPAVIEECHENRHPARADA